MHGGGGALKLEAKKLGSKAARKKAFTLAEVLITLAIIGVVAALTIPTVIAKYQKKQYYSQFMKTYNTLSNAISMAVNENGTYDTWGVSGSTSDQKREIFNNNIAPYLKISKVCETSSDCGFNNDKLSFLNMDGEYNYYEVVSNFDSYPIILNDGSLVAFNLDPSSMIIIFDTNGLKGPNIAGRDIFLDFEYGKYNGTWKLMPGMMSDAEDQATLLEQLNGEDDSENCTMEHTSQGMGCAARLLLEGKMNY